MKKTNPAKKKLGLKLKRELIKILTTHDLEQPRGGGREEGDSCSSGGSNPSVPY
jgi:hypothetical protein